MIRMLFAFGLLCAHLSSFQVSTDLFLVQDLPQAIKDENPLGEYSTLFTFKNWPENGAVKVFVERPLQKKKGELGVITSQSSSFRVDSIGYLPGEEIVIVFRDTKGKFLHRMKFAPYPLIGSFPDKAKMEIILKDPKNDIYTINFTGFKKREKLETVSISDGEKIEDSSPFTDGFKKLYMPAVLGKEGGIARYSVTRSSGETIDINVPWGKERLKYIVYFDEDGNPKSMADHL